MPTYSYECKKCKKVFDLFVLVQSRDTIFISCEYCENSGTPQKEFSRMIVASTFHLKGRGWAKDGYTHREQ